MTAQPFSAVQLLAILPELILLILGVLVMGLDLAWKSENKRNLGWVTAAGLLAAGVAGLVFSRPPAEPVLIFGGMLRFDMLAFVFRMVVLGGAALTALFSMDHPAAETHGEYFTLLIAASFGMCLMSAAADLMMLYLAIETTALPLYVLAGFQIHNRKSVEAGLKYFIYGAVTSAVMLYGFSWLYGLSGQTNLYAIAEANLPEVMLLGAGLLALLGIAFKISAVPAHFWAPDVYDGAPTPVTGFLSTVSKAAGFAVLARVSLAAFQPVAVRWDWVLMAMAVASMVLGNVVALRQRHVKRLLAYSSIAQAGYILVGVAVGNELGLAGAIYYLVSYLATNLVAFGVTAFVEKSTGSDQIEAFQGLARRAPGLALAMLAALLSLGGVPPLSGFFSKLVVFGAAVQAGYAWLAFVGVATSVVGLYYYLTLLRTLYQAEEAVPNQPVVVSNAWKTALLISVAGVIVLGVVYGPLFEWSAQAARSLLF